MRRQIVEDHHRERDRLTRCGLRLLTTLSVISAGNCRSWRLGVLYRSNRFGVVRRRTPHLDTGSTGPLKGSTTNLRMTMCACSESLHDCGVSLGALWCGTSLQGVGFSVAPRPSATQRSDRRRAARASGLSFPPSGFRFHFLIPHSSFGSHFLIPSFGFPFRLKMSSPPSASTMIFVPSGSLPSRMRVERGFSTRRWMVRWSGRAP